MLKARLFAALALLCFCTSVWAAGSTVNPAVPVANSLMSSAPIRNNFAAAYYDINNLFGQSNSATAPASPTLGQLWLNTTTNPYVLSEWDGAEWVAQGTLNATTHTWAFSLSGSVAWSSITGTPTTLAGYGITNGVSSVGLTMPSSFSCTGSPVTSSGTIACALNSQAGGLFLASPSGTAGTPSFRPIQVSDIPTLNQNTTGTASNVTGVVTPANGGTGVTTSTGTGSVVLSTSPTLTTPALGTPSSAVLTNATGLPISTGVSGLGAGVAAALGNTASGTGSVVLSTLPAITTPTITGAENHSGTTSPIELNGSAGTSGQILTSAGAGTTPTWTSVGSSGTVTSVNVSGGTTGLAFSGGPVTTSGTITAAGTLGLANGGTGATSKAAAFTALSPMTTTGDLEYESATNAAGRLPIGSSGQVLTVAGGVPTWATAGAVTPGYIYGFTLSNDAATPSTVLDIAAGYAASSTNTSMITGTATTKSLSSYTAGAGGGGLAPGLTLAASTWYHVYAIVVGGTYDVYFDISPTAAFAPSGTSSYRYIGSFQTSASSQVTAFTQKGQTFYYAAPVRDINDGGTTSPSLIALTVPTGFNVYPLIQPYSISGGVGFVWSPSSGATVPPNNNISNTSYGPVDSIFITNTSAQLYFQMAGTGNLDAYTYGYINPHVAANW